MWRAGTAARRPADRPPVRAVTDLADQAVLLPLALAVAAFLALMGWRRGVLAWAGVTGALLATMLLLKLGFAACGPAPAPGSPWGPLANPSGHTAAAAAILGGAAGLLARDAWRRRAAVLGAVVAAAVIGTTRVVLHRHSIADVVAGGAVGVAAATILALCAGAAPAAPGRRRWLLLPLIVVPLLLHGRHLDAEARIHDAAHGWLRGLCHRATARLPGPEGGAMLAARGIWGQAWQP